MEKHFDLSDAAFEEKINTCEFNPGDFSHEAHLRLTWINIAKYGLEQVEKNVQLQLQQFVKFVGAADKYNTTLTIAATKAVYHFMLKSISNNFVNFIAEFPELKHNFRELMATHYALDIYYSAQAKKAFLAPDLMPFD